MVTARLRHALLVAVLGLAGAVARAAESKPLVPTQIGGLPYKTAKKFDDPALGISLSYQGDNTTLNIFVYNGGVGDIPNGIDTVVALQQFEQAKSDVLASKAWTTVRFVSDGTVLLASKANLKSYLALFEASDGDTQYYSILYLTTGRNRFYKARLTTRKGNPILEPEPMAQLRRDLGDFIVSLIQR
jgi:hypothetical protein